MPPFMCPIQLKAHSCYHSFKIEYYRIHIFFLKSLQMQYVADLHVHIVGTVIVNLVYVVKLLPKLHSYSKLEIVPLRI